MALAGGISSGGKPEGIFRPLGPATGGSRNAFRPAPERASLGGPRAKPSSICHPFALSKLAPNHLVLGNPHDWKTFWRRDRGDDGGCDRPGARGRDLRSQPHYRPSDDGLGQGVSVSTTTTISGLSFFANLLDGGDGKFMIWNGDNSALLSVRPSASALPAPQAGSARPATSISPLTQEAPIISVSSDTT